MSQDEQKSFVDLMKEVINPGLCTVCGTCVAVCPYNVLVLREESFKRLELHELEVAHDIYETIEKLCQQCGYCYYNCPVASFNLEKAEKDEFGSISKDAVKKGYIKVKRLPIEGLEKNKRISKIKVSTRSN